MRRPRLVLAGDAQPTRAAPSTSWTCAAVDAHLAREVVGATRGRARPCGVSSPKASAWRFSAEEDARLRVGVQEDLDISSAESRRRASFFTSRSAISVLFEIICSSVCRVDDEALRVLEDDRASPCAACR